MLLPGLHLKHLRRIQLLGIVLLAKVKIAGNNLVKSIYYQFDIVEMRIIAKGVVVLQVILPTKLRTEIKVKDLKVIRVGVD